MYSAQENNVLFILLRLSAYENQCYGRKEKMAETPDKTKIHQNCQSKQVFSVQGISFNCLENSEVKKKWRSTVNPSYNNWISG